MSRWARKVFKIYKTLKLTEQRTISALNLEQLPLSRKLLKLVVVLYNLRNGLSPEEVRERIQMEKVADKTDEICKESKRDVSSYQVQSVGSLDESSLLSATPSTAAYLKQFNSIQAPKRDEISMEIQQEANSTIEHKHQLQPYQTVLTPDLEVGKIRSCTNHD